MAGLEDAPPNGRSASIVSVEETKEERRKRLAREDSRLRYAQHGRRKSKFSDEELKFRAKESARRYYERNKAKPGWLEQKLASNRARDLANPEAVRTRQTRWRKTNPDRDRAKQVRWRENNKGKIAVGDKRRRLQNPEKHREQLRAWAAKNPDKVREQTKRRRPKAAAYEKRRYAKDLEFRLRCKLKRRLAAVIKKRGGHKSASIIELLGCTLEQFISHMESLFQPGMSWENRGEWHLDHIRPLASFNITDPEQQGVATHYTNIQPLWARDNQRKKHRLDWKPSS